MATHKEDMRTKIRVNFLRKTKIIIILELKKTTIMRETEKQWKQQCSILRFKKTTNKIKLDSYSESVVSIFVPFILSSKRLRVTSLVWQEIVCCLLLKAPSLQGSRNTCLQHIQLSLSYTTRSASLRRLQTDTAWVRGHVRRWGQPISFCWVNEGAQVEKWHAIVCRTWQNGPREHAHSSVLSQLSTHQPTGVNSIFLLMLPHLEAQRSEKFPSGPNF